MRAAVVVGLGIASIAVAVTATGCHRRHADDGVAASSPEDEDRAACDRREPEQCVGNDLVSCEPDGRLGRRLRTCKDGCRQGACVAQCSADGAELIYVVDTANELLAFDPRKLGSGDPFRVVGQLACGGRGTPFSMAIDRSGTAWVLYSSGEIFAVSITDASCRRTTYAPDGVFGMGYVSDAPGSKTETLYLARNDGSELESVDASLHRHVIGPLSATVASGPELTGTSAAKLFGFYPVEDAPSFVQEIDKASGDPIGPRWPLGTQPLGLVHAYAFAQWGGVFYVFVTSEDGGSTVRAVDPRGGDAKIVLHDLPMRITGAGVSTCAPERDGQ